MSAVRVLAAAVLLFCCSCSEPILHDLSEADANKVLLVLAKISISAKKHREGSSWQVAVPKELANKALKGVEQSRVLRRGSKQGSERSSGRMLLSKEERIRFFERELSWGLEKTLERLPYVLEARVHVNLKAPQRLSLKKNLAAQSASVLLISDTPAQIDASSIKRLVSGAAGVETSSVSVLVSRAATAAGNTSALSLPVSHELKEQSLRPSPQTPQLQAAADEAAVIGQRFLQKLHWQLLALASLSAVFFMVQVSKRQRRTVATLVPPPNTAAVANAEKIDDGSQHYRANGRANGALSDTYGRVP